MLTEPRLVWLAGGIGAPRGPLDQQLIRAWSPSTSPWCLFPMHGTQLRPSGLVTESSPLAPGTVQCGTDRYIRDHRESEDVAVGGSCSSRSSACGATCRCGFGRRRGARWGARWMPPHWHSRGRSTRDGSICRMLHPPHLALDPGPMASGGCGRGAVGAGLAVSARGSGDAGRLWRRLIAVSSVTGGIWGAGRLPGLPDTAPLATPPVFRLPGGGGGCRGLDLRGVGLAAVHWAHPKVGKMDPQYRGPVGNGRIHTRRGSAPGRAGGGVPGPASGQGGDRRNRQGG